MVITCPSCLLVKVKVLVAQLCPALCNPVVCPSNSAGKSSGVDNHSLLPEIFLKEIAAHSSIHAWRISWTEEPVRLPSVGLQRVRHD